MANLKFYKMAQAPVGTTEKPLEAGAIWFNTTNHSIEVFDGAKWSVFSGVIDASVANEILTITKHDGSTVSVDFSIYATDEALNLLEGRVETLETTVGTQSGNITDLQGRMTTVETKASTAEGKLAGLTEATVMAEIAKQVKVADDRAVAKENELAGKITTLETTVNTDHEDRIDALEALFTGTEGTSVQGLIDAAIEKNNTDVVTPGLDSKVDKTTYEAYVESNNERVAAVEKEIDDEVVRATAAEAGIQEQIGEGFSKDATVAAAVKDAKDAAAAAQKTIDDFLTGEGVDPQKVDALKEIVAYMDEHGEEYAAVVENLDTLNTDVATLKTNVGEGTVDSRIATAKTEAIAAAKTETENQVKAEMERSEAAYEKIGVAKDLVDELAERVAVNEGAVATVDSRIATAKSEAIADAEGKIATAKTELQGYADQAELDAVASAKTYTDGEIKKLSEGAVADNTTAIAALDAKVTAGFQWVKFE